MTAKRTPHRPSEPLAVERVRSQRPEDETWRADALGRSRHTRMADELRAPTHDPDPGRARLLCADVCRGLLGDLSASLVLLAPRDRRRAQTLAAYLRTLFNFALQSGLEGERLARINRWQFELDRALEGEEPGQPIFVAMRREHLDRAWDPAGLDAFAAAARRAAITKRSGRELAELAPGICLALPGLPAESEVLDLVSRLVLILARRRQSLAEPSTTRPESRRFGFESPEIAPRGTEPSAHDPLVARLEAPAFESAPRSWRRLLHFLASVADDFERDASEPRPLGVGNRLLRLLRSLLRG